MRCRFNFDWDAKEDTSQEKLHEGALLFGRGLRAGVDQRAQREALAKSEQTYLNQMRKARGEHTSDADVAADINRAQRAAHVDDDPVSLSNFFILACFTFSPADYILHNAELFFSGGICCLQCSRDTLLST